MKLTRVPAPAAVRYPSFEEFCHHREAYLRAAAGTMGAVLVAASLSACSQAESGGKDHPNAAGVAQPAIHQNARPGTPPPTCGTPPPPQPAPAVQPPVGIDGDIAFPSPPGEPPAVTQPAPPAQPPVKLLGDPAPPAPATPASIAGEMVAPQPPPRIQGRIAAPRPPQPASHDDKQPE